MSVPCCPSSEGSAPRTLVFSSENYRYSLPSTTSKDAAAFALTPLKVYRLLSSSGHHNASPRLEWIGGCPTKQQTTTLPEDEKEEEKQDQTSSSSSSSSFSDTRTVRIATMNVLADVFPPVVEMAIKSKERIKAYTNPDGYVAVEGGAASCSSSSSYSSSSVSPRRHRPFVDVGADILCLNEVTANIMAAFCGVSSSNGDDVGEGGGGGIMGVAGYRYAVFYGCGTNDDDNEDGTSSTSSSASTAANTMRMQSLLADDMARLVSPPPFSTARAIFTPTPPSSTAAPAANTCKSHDGSRWSTIASALCLRQSNGAQKTPSSPPPPPTESEIAAAATTAAAAGPTSRIDPHGCVIFSKYPIVAAWRGCNSRELFAMIEGVPAAVVPPPAADNVSTAVPPNTNMSSTTTTPLIVCSRHTTAYARPETKARRVQEVGRSAEICRAFGAAQQQQQQNNENGEEKKETAPLPIPFVILGDLNLHDFNEDGDVIIRNGLVDVYAATNTEMGATAVKDGDVDKRVTSDGDNKNNIDPQFTFDPVRNPMIKRYIPGESRRMRLDRILLPSEGYCHYDCGDDDSSCVDHGNHADGDKNICNTSSLPSRSPHRYPPIPTRYAFASCQRMWGTEPIADELTLSDHYGLVVDLAFYNDHHNHNDNNDHGGARNGTEQRLPLPLLPQYRHFNPVAPYPGLTSMQKRAAMPSDQSNARVGIVNNVKFWSRFAWVVATNHGPWMVKEWWWKGKGQKNAKKGVGK